MAQKMTKSSRTYEEREIVWDGEGWYALGWGINALVWTKIGQREADRLINRGEIANYVTFEETQER